MILDSQINRYFGLNGSGAVVWTILSNGGSTESAISELTMRFDISSETAAADVATLVQELLQLNILAAAAP